MVGESAGILISIDMRFLSCGGPAGLGALFAPRSGGVKTCCRRQCYERTRNRRGVSVMRTYLVVIDETPEAEIALRFAARRAIKTGGSVEILALIPRPEFLQWGGVMATMEEETRVHAEAL